jgi:hypothetical protein
LETLAAKGKPTAVGTAATAEFLAPARIPGTSAAVRTERAAGPTAATRGYWNGRERQQQQDPEVVETPVRMITTVWSDTKSTI